jgi:hypothetical protein
MFDRLGLGPRTLAVTAFAAAVLIMLTGARVAEATVLCKGSTETSMCNVVYGSLVPFEGSLTLFTKAKLTTPAKTIECNQSTFVYESAFGSEGSTGSTVAGPVSTLTFAECNCTVTVVKSGSLEIHYISGTDNGTVTSTGAEITTLCGTPFGNVHCIYTTENTDLGTLVGGNPARLSFSNVNIPRRLTDFLCGEEAKWTAEYIISEPKPVYVSAG